MKWSSEEQLRIIFSLENDGEPPIAGELLSFRPRVGGISPDEAFLILIKEMSEMGLDDEFLVSGRKLSSSAMLKKIQRDGGWGRIETEELEFQYGVVANFEHSFVLIKEKKHIKKTQWHQLVKPFLGNSHFVQALVENSEYSYWQNVSDTMLYDLAGRDYSGLPLKSNGLPPPLDRLEIDVSSNPGHVCLQNGFVEAIGLTMWLGKLFWEHAKSKQQAQLERSNWIDYAELDNGVIKIELKDFFVLESEKLLEFRAMLYGRC